MGDCSTMDYSLRPDGVIEVKSHAQGTEGHKFSLQGRARWPEILTGLLDVKLSGLYPYRSM